MACEQFDLNDPNLFNSVALVILEGMEAQIQASGLKMIKRSYHGFGPIPSEDCCPDLVVWISNIRLWDSDAPDTLQENRILKHFGIAFDVNVRIGECFFEVDSKGELIHTADVMKMSGAINKYAHAAYLGSVNSLLNLLQCGVNVTPGSAFPFQEGGCAGFTWAITVSVI